MKEIKEGIITQMKATNSYKNNCI